MIEKPKWTDLFGIDPERAIRRQVAEEVAEAIEDLNRHDYQFDEFDVGVGAAAKVARDIGSQPPPDVTSECPGCSQEDTSHRRDCEQSPLCGCILGVVHLRSDHREISKGDTSI